MFSGRRIVRVIGETIREIGILIIVFVPLDAALGVIVGGIIVESRK